jgi:hypothetical protein
MKHQSALMGSGGFWGATHPLWKNFFNLLGFFEKKSKTPLKFTFNTKKFLDSPLNGQV